MLSKVCGVCKEDLPITEFTKDSARKDGLRYQCRKCIRAYNQNNRVWARPYYQQYRDTHKEETRARTKKSRKTLRTTILELLGNVCACCGDTTYEFLAVDHINGGGNQHRKSLKNPCTIYRQIRDDPEFRKLFQVLCHNCNCSRGFHGYCPHERED